jgi:hypothetical protein
MARKKPDGMGQKKWSKMESDGVKGETKTNLEWDRTFCGGT